MRIVFLIKRSAQSYFYVNSVQEKFNVIKVIEEVPDQITQSTNYGILPRLKKAIRNHSLRTFLMAFLDKIIVSLNAVNREQSVRDDNVLRAKILGKKSNGLNTKLSTIKFRDINSKDVKKLLNQLKPDLILLQGTSIVKQTTLPKNILTLNIHPGLTPYYRGGGSVLWALINWDPYNIGCTVHKANDSSDAGDIISQERLIPKSDDTWYGINLKLNKIATGLVIEIIESLKLGKNLKFVKQDLKLGRCYYHAHGQHAKEFTRSYIKKIEKDNKISEMLKRPSSKYQYPIVKFNNAKKSI